MGEWPVDGEWHNVYFISFDLFLSFWFCTVYLVTFFYIILFRSSSHFWFHLIHSAKTSPHLHLKSISLRSRLSSYPLLIHTITPWFRLLLQKKCLVYNVLHENIGRSCNEVCLAIGKSILKCVHRTNNFKSPCCKIHKGSSSNNFAHFTLLTIILTVGTILWVCKVIMLNM